MKRLILALPIVLFVACEKQSSGTIKDVTAEQVAGWLKDKTALVLDANTPDFRAQNGVVSGAVLLDNYLDWDPPTVLGPDKNKQLVFYCTSRT